MPFLWGFSSVAGAGTVSPEAKNCFEWFNSLGFSDVKDCQFVCVTVKWSDPKGKWPARSQSKNAFLLTGNQDAFMVQDLELFRRSYRGRAPEENVVIEASYKPANLKNEASAFLHRINRLKHGEDLFDRLEERISKRVFTFVFAWACWRNGLDDEAEKLYQASKHMRYGIEEVDENNFQGVLEQEISYAVMWRAVMDFGNVSINRPKLLNEFQNFSKHYPFSSYAERAKRTAEMLARMIAEDVAHAKTAPTNLDQLPVEERVRELIFQLRDQHGQQFGQPGWCDIFNDTTNSPAHQLVKIGYPAVPQLIAALEDPTFTRSVGYWRDFTFSHNVLTVGDCAVSILWRITGKHFYLSNHTAGFMSTDQKVSETHKLAEAWWAEFQKKGEKQMLVEGVEAGDDNTISVASRLVAHYPDAAPDALAKGIRATTSATVAAEMSEDMRVRRAANIRKALIEIFQKCDSNATQTFLQKELHEGNDGSRVSAAEVLIQSNRDDVIKAMIQEWQNSPDYKVEQDQCWTECARFLASVDSPQAIWALGQNFQARPLNTRMAILHNVGEGGTLYGQIRPISERSLSAGAVEDFLIERLGDTELGAHTIKFYRERNARVCDVAGYYLNKLWPSSYHFVYTDHSVKISDQERIEFQNVWKQSRK